MVASHVRGGNGNRRRGHGAEPSETRGRRRESHIVAEAAERILADLADPQSINQANNGAWKEPLWHALGEAGLPLAWVRTKEGDASIPRHSISSWKSPDM
jgi:hypothetical protein